MKAKKKKKLKAAGWRVGTASEFLDLTPEEEALIEMKLALAEYLRKKRQKERMTQTQLAKLLGSSQSRVAKMEAADAAVSMDLLVRGLLVLGVSPKQVARIIGAGVNQKAA
jgi:predicted XRE-type DNA-binding protein